MFCHDLNLRNIPSRKIRQNYTLKCSYFIELLPVLFSLCLACIAKKKIHVNNEIAVLTQISAHHSKSHKRYPKKVING